MNKLKKMGERQGVGRLEDGTARVEIGLGAMISWIIRLARITRSLCGISDN